jgi:transmembrane sensor
MDNNKAQQLLDKYLSGNCSPHEKTLIESWYNSTVVNQEDSRTAIDYDLMRERILNNLPINNQFKRKRLWLPYAAAAMLVITLGTGLFFYFYKSTASYYANDVKPGGNKAILTLANGKQIVLTNAHNGKLAEQGNATVQKTAEGYLAYNTGKTVPESAVVFNTINTPRGGQYWVTLADGSRVLLNAASSLKYPVAFTGATRQVELTGEAYFEVAHNKAQPFIVKTLHQQVQVLGTHFNVNSYDDEESTNTTLLEGSVKVTTDVTTAMLVPGEQAVLNDKDNKIKLQQADLENIMAWKNGDFVFKEESLASIMRKVSRWYDVDVVYADTQKQNAAFGGWVSRSKNISAVLKVIELTGKVHFKVEGRRITVM